MSKEQTVSNTVSETAMIGVTKDDYILFVVYKLQNEELLESISWPSDEVELECGVNADTWLNFLLNDADAVEQLREQMAANVRSISHHLDHKVLAVMKDTVINLLAEEIEHNEEEIRDIRRKQLDVEVATRIDKVVPMLVSALGLYNYSTEDAIKKALYHLHPGLLER